MRSTVICLVCRKLFGYRILLITGVDIQNMRYIICCGDGVLLTSLAMFILFLWHCNVQSTSMSSSRRKWISLKSQNVYLLIILILIFSTLSIFSTYLLIFEFLDYFISFCRDIHTTTGKLRRAAMQFTPARLHVVYLFMIKYDSCSNLLMQTAY